jgi:F-type H+-transporting ATPase subunit gamma
MSLSRELQLHIEQLKEIRGILHAMKNLAFMQIHKLQRLKAAQSRVVANIERAARDFLHFYPELAASEDIAEHICILLGTERGFCGDFNDSLIKAIETASYSGIIAIGSRLSARLDGVNPAILAAIDGANVTEEVPVIINRLIDAINSLHGNDAGVKAASFLRLTVVYHDSASNRITRQQILPPFWQKSEQVFPGHPPTLNLKPADFFAELVDHYLFAALHEILYSSLMAENQRRQQHLDGAVNHLDEESKKLHRKSQLYRQEEITEEIEVILLNTENL